jgi:hypothetical protein
MAESIFKELLEVAIADIYTLALAELYSLQFKNKISLPGSSLLQQ